MVTQREAPVALVAQHAFEFPEQAEKPPPVETEAALQRIGQDPREGGQHRAVDDDAARRGGDQAGAGGGGIPTVPQPAEAGAERKGGDRILLRDCRRREPSPMSPARVSPA